MTTVYLLLGGRGAKTLKTTITAQRSSFREKGQLLWMMVKIESGSCVEPFLVTTFAAVLTLTLMGELARPDLIRRVIQMLMSSMKPASPQANLEWGRGG